MASSFSRFSIFSSDLTRDWTRPPSRALARKRVMKRSISFILRSSLIRVFS